MWLIRYVRVENTKKKNINHSPHLHISALFLHERTVKKWIKMTLKARSLHILQQVSTVYPGLSVLWCLPVFPLCITSVWICRWAVWLLSNDVSDVSQTLLINSVTARCLWHHGKWLQHQGVSLLLLLSAGSLSVTL